MEEESNNGGEYNRHSQMEGVSQDGDYDGKLSYILINAKMARSQEETASWLKDMEMQLEGLSRLEMEKTVNPLQLKINPIQITSDRSLNLPTFFQWPVSTNLERIGSITLSLMKNFKILSWRVKSLEM